MWATVAVALLAVANGACGYTVDVVVPAEPEYGSRVVLECNYRMDHREYIEEMTWQKDGQVFLTYEQRPNDVYTWDVLDGVTINTKESSPSRVILEDVGDAASGTYSVRMSIASRQAGSNSRNTFSHDQDMVVGGAANTLGTRFNNRRPAGGSGGTTGTTTFTSFQSSSAGNAGDVPVGGVDPLGTRFGGATGAAGAAGAAGFGGATGAAGEAGAAGFAGAAGAAPPPVSAAAAPGLQNAINQLQNAQNHLANALNAALGGVQG